MQQARANCLHRAPVRPAIADVSSAHMYQPGASLAKARQVSMGRVPPRMNMTVSKVESSAGTVQAAQTMAMGNRREVAMVESLVRRGL